MVLKGNINLATNVLTTTLSLLFGGGTALLNFLLQIVSSLNCKFFKVLHRRYHIYLVIEVLNILSMMFYNFSRSNVIYGT